MHDPRLHPTWPTVYILALAGLAMTLAPLTAHAALTDEVRREIIVHEHERNLTDGVLVTLAGDPDPEVRVRALTALGRIQDPSLVKTLEAALTDTEASVRRAGAFALGQLFDEVAVPSIETALSREIQPAVRTELILALGKCGEESAVQTLVSVLASNPSEAAPIMQAIGHLGQRGVDVTTAASAVENGARSDDPEISWRACFAIQRGRISGAANGLRRALVSPHPETRVYACRAAGSINRKWIVDSLLDRLNDEDWRVRVEALKALSELEEVRFVGKYSLLLEDPNENVRHTAIEVLGSLPGGMGFNRLIDYLNTSDWLVRGLVLQAMARATGEGALVELSDGTRDPDWRVRMATANAFAFIDTEQALLLLETMINDEKPQVQAAVINALVTYPQIEAVRIIRTGLKSDDLAVLTSAAAAAGTRLDRVATDDLLSVYESLVSPVDSEPMVAILTSLGQILAAKDEDGPVGTMTPATRAAAMNQLRSAAGDPDVNVAAAAKSALATLESGEEIVVETPPHAFPTFDADIALAMETLTTKPVAHLITSRGEITLELLPSVAPVTVANFVELARDGYYNGLRFHRVVADFVIQTGDPRGDGWGGPGYAIRCEYSDLPYETGMLGMATAGKDTGGSQFFITHSPQPHLEGRYTIFGRVLEGQAVVDRIRIGDTIKEVVLEGL